MSARRPVATRTPAPRLPIARVCVDLELPHLDRLFDYLVPVESDVDCQVGTRVRVRFAGKLRDGFVIDRIERSDHPGRLSYVDRSVSAEAVVTVEIARLVRAVADRHAGTMSDVLRLAVPPRHAAAESEQSPPFTEASDQNAVPTRTGWDAYPDGRSFCTALAEGRPARAVWSALPGGGDDAWPALLADAAACALASGRSAVLVMPDARDVARVDAALTARLGAGRHVALSAGLGPKERYRRWLSILRGSVRVVLGTRAAAFAPVRDPGLLVIWDDGDDSHVEPRSPYCHARDVLTTRAAMAGSAVLVGGPARTAEGQLLVESEWARSLVAAREAVRSRVARVVATGDDVQAERDPGARSARLPSLAWQTARAALARDEPVLVQVPRAGYRPALACDRCRSRALCPQCSGPLAHLVAGADPRCRWCDRTATGWECPRCGSRRTRAVVVGAGRTREELGRAFPGVSVISSAGSEIRDTVLGGAAIVVSTPGAEPVADGGYGAALLLDGWAMLTRPDLRAAEAAVRKWMTAAVLVRSADAGGVVVICADGGGAAVQALVRWDPAGFAARELAERTELSFPPAQRFASLTAAAGDLDGALSGAELPIGAEVLGPVPVDDDTARLLVRVPRAESRELAAALAALTRTRAAHKELAPIRVEIDPIALW